MRVTTYFSFVLLVIVSVCCRAETNDHLHDKQQLIALKQLFEQSVADNSMEKLQPHLAPEFSVVMFTDNEFSDFDQFVIQWNASRDKFLNGGSYQLQLNPDTTNFINDIALAKGNAQHTIVTGDGTHYAFSSHWTVVAQKLNNEWKLLRIHASTNPFDNAVVKDKVQQLLRRVALLCVVMGGLLGMIGTAVYYRRRKIRA